MSPSLFSNVLRERRGLETRRNVVNCKEPTCHTNPGFLSMVLRGENPLPCRPHLRRDPGKNAGRDPHTPGRNPRSEAPVSSASTRPHCRGDRRERNFRPDQVGAGAGSGVSRECRVPCPRRSVRCGRRGEPDATARAWPCGGCWLAPARPSCGRLC